MRRLLPIVVLLTVLGGRLDAVPVAAETAVPAEVQTSIRLGDEDADAQRAAAAAVELSRLEASRDFSALYAKLHPDSRGVVPEAAVVGWYEADFAGKRTEELTVTGVTFVDWTWGVTGRRYPRTAEVAFVQPYWVDGVRQDVAGATHLVEYRGEWGWFFGASKEFVDAQIALYAPEFRSAVASAVPTDPVEAAERATRFPDPLHANIDAFWAEQFALARVPYTPPNGVVGFDRPIATGCGPADPATEAAFYCVLDETIYYSTAFRTSVEQTIGDFGWVTVVAHEWGHHIQFLLGADLGTAPDLTGGPAPIEIEQQADCGAGAYAEEAEQTGWLEPGDVEEAIAITKLSGDPVGTAWDDPFAHGSGQQRVDAFESGFQGGLAACAFPLAQAA